MIDFDNAQVAIIGVIAIALLVPVLYSFFIDNHKKGTEDPRDVKF